ncbi:MAG: hypothetical protein H7258_13845 [Ferruginibacter sp.]|nr:hypothetical protein [Ferruginibacter sp.]
MNILQGTAASTPEFFKKLRNIELIVAAIGTSIVTAPIGLLAAVITIVAYEYVVSAVLRAVSQVTILSKKEFE